MDWLRQHMRDHISNVQPSRPIRMASEGELPRTGPAVFDTDALDLVREAANVLRRMGEQRAAAKTRADALVERAAGELKAARDRIQALEMDCERLNRLVAQSKDQLLSAEKALEGAETRISTLETHLAASEKRAGDAEDMLLLVENTIHSELLEPMRSKTEVLAAA
jgi:septal ring factor EnvC (AmiA/AmiB activator)